MYSPISASSTDKFCSTRIAKISAMRQFFLLAAAKGLLPDGHPIPNTCKATCPRSNGEVPSPTTGYVHTLTQYQVDPYHPSTLGRDFSSPSCILFRWLLHCPIPCRLTWHFGSISAYPAFSPLSVTSAYTSHIYTLKTTDKTDRITYCYFRPYVS